MLVVPEMTCRYHLGVEYDDVLRLVTTVVEARGAIVNRYEAFRGDTPGGQGAQRRGLHQSRRSGHPPAPPCWSSPIRQIGKRLPVQLRRHPAKHLGPVAPRALAKQSQRRVPGRVLAVR